MTENALNNPESPESGFSWKVSAVIATSIVVFLMLFQPFGMVINSALEVLIIVGLAPLNFAALILLHLAPLPRGPIRMLIAALVMVSLNYIYLALFSAPEASLFLRVMLVGGVAIVAIAAWRRQENLRREVIELRNAPRQASEDIVLRGESDSEVLTIPRANLRYVEAQGNYARVAWAGSERLSERLLRATLKDIEVFAGGALLRCHRSYLVNLSEAERIEGNSKGLTIHFPDGVTTPVSRKYVDQIRIAALAEQSV